MNLGIDHLTGVSGSFRTFANSCIVHIDTVIMPLDEVELDWLYNCKERLVFGTNPTDYQKRRVEMGRWDKIRVLGVDQFIQHMKRW